MRALPRSSFRIQVWNSVACLRLHGAQEAGSTLAKKTKSDRERNRAKSGALAQDGRESCQTASKRALKSTRETATMHKERRRVNAHIDIKVEVAARCLEDGLVAGQGPGVLVRHPGVQLNGFSLLILYTPRRESEEEENWECCCAGL